MEEKYFDLISRHNFYDTSNFNVWIDKMFIEAQGIDPINGINEIFIMILRLVSRSRRQFKYIIELFGANYSKCNLKIPTTLTIEQIQYMISLEANPNYKNDLPFVIGCCYTSDIALFFINEYHANINAYNGEAFNCDKSDTIKLLLEYDPIITEKVIQGCLDSLETIQILIDRCDYLNLQKIFLVHPKLNSYLPDVANFLINKIKQEPDLVSIETLNDIMIRRWLSFDDIKTLISLGANPRYKNDSVLFNYWDKLDRQWLEYFINECGCDINVNDSSLLSTIYDGDINEVKLLLDFGCKITDKIISWAFDNNDIECLKLFIEYGVDPERIGRLFMERVLDNRESVAKFLLQSNVDINQIIFNLSGRKN